MSSALTLESQVRPGGAVAADGQRADRHFMEFVVDGERLGRVVGPFLGYADATEEYVSVLVADWPTGIALQDVARLMGAAPAELPDGRIALYVCAECGDLGCGAVTAVVEIDEEEVVWRELGYQNNYEPLDQAAIFNGVGPFVFDRSAYLHALEQFRSGVDDAADEPLDNDESQ